MTSTSVSVTYDLAGIYGLTWSYCRLYHTYMIVNLVSCCKHDAIYTGHYLGFNGCFAAYIMQEYIEYEGRTRGRADSPVLQQHVLAAHVLPHHQHQQPRLVALGRHPHVLGAALVY